ncbi:MAG: DUF11 domain-containing protein [Firmicutes bacterium]|nr:DUF11 domain-containing protein [Bacillota bacterium]
MPHYNRIPFNFPAENGRPGSVVPAAVLPGNTLTYTVTVTNNGPSDAEDVVITDIAPAQLTGVVFSVDNGVTWQSWTGSYVHGALANGTTASILVRGTVAAGTTGNISNSSAVSSTTFDPDTTNNSVTVVVPVEDTADLAVVKSGIQSSVAPGDILAYMITVTNNGPAAAADVTVTDAVPGVLTGTKFSTNGGVSWQPWTGSYALGSLLSGASLALLLRSTVSSSAGGSITNTAVVSSTTADPDLSNNSATVVTPIVTSADLLITKAGDQAAVQPGGTLTYTITVANNGPNDAQNVTVTDAIPAVLTGTEFSTNGGVSWQPWTGSYALGSLLNGASFPLLLRSTVSATATGSIINTAVASSTTPDPDLSNNSAILTTLITPVAASADLALTKSSGQTSVQPGGVLTYIITVNNNGPDDAQNVTVTDAVPSVLSGVEYSIDGGNTWQPWTGAYVLGSLLNGASFPLLLRSTVSLSASGNIINTAVVSSTTPDPNLSNNSAILLTPVTPVAVSADLALTKSSGQTTVQPGGTLTYTITVTNSGPDDAQNVTVTDAVPSVLSGTEFSTDGGNTWQPWTGAYVLGSLLSGASFPLLLRSTVSLSASGTITNTAVVSSTTPDPNLSNNSAILLTPITPPVLAADLAITKSGGQTSVRPGDLLTYTVTVLNNGPNDAQNVNVTDAVPAALTGAEFSTNGGITWQPWTGTYNLALLPNGDSFTLLIRGTVSTAAGGNIINTATVSSTTPDPDISNNSSTSTIIVISHAANLSVAKTACPHVASPCCRITYNIVVSNSGPDEAVNVTLMDFLPVEVCKTQYSLDGGQTWHKWCLWYNSLSLGNLPANLSVTVLLRGVVHRCARVSLTNTATVSSETADPNLNNNQFTLVTRIRHCRRNPIKPVFLCFLGLETLNGHKQ